MSRRALYSRFHVATAFIAGCCIGSLLLTAVHFSHLDNFQQITATTSDTSHHHPLKHHQHQQKQIQTALSKKDAGVQEEAPSDPEKKSVAFSKPKQNIAANHDNIVHAVAGLKCDNHGGPSAEAAQEMVYWRDLPQDNTWTSPFLKKDGTRQYLTFEPDGGGWNNIRMSMETVLTMALAMGRVLVLPPSQKMYLLGKTNFNFADFFPLQELAEEHEGLEIITMEQFLEETMGKLKDTTTQQIVYPPSNKRTKWDGDSNGIKRELGPFLQSIAANPNWDPRHCIAAFPQSKEHRDVKALEQAMREIMKEGVDFKNLHDEYINHPTPVDASTKHRLREFLAGRDKLCIYDESLQNEYIIHFHGKAKKDVGGRLLVHFYAFLFFQDWKTDLWMKRFVRDHVRYIDEIQCAAARIVSAIRSTKLKTSDNGQFDSFHIRRGDFQYKSTRVSGEEIVAAAKDEIPTGRTVYIGTDERDKKFFKPLQEHGWELLFLDDFMDHVGDINPNYYGMIDQLVASRGHTFFGCWFSTFTGYIVRLRGYHTQTSVLDIADGSPESIAYQEGRLPHSYYYAMLENKNKLHDYWPIKQAFYAREFPASWWRLDFDVSD
ncbi:GDP-fucose protein O-fucosyltransferase [Nitzschia inconspicua]|uniref:GDP-fucose protein O-fucosyltransferase n=1 Tax=Nitzschia inconspicua TaxID=303405 RepID=A0A9K3KPX3_9STRA|nr:GDP-fucose protein O-fucosyltransferase [Nitzschia inconspicua]